MSPGTACHHWSHLAKSLYSERLFTQPHNSQGYLCQQRPTGKRQAGTERQHRDPFGSGNLLEIFSCLHHAPHKDLLLMAQSFSRRKNQYLLQHTHKVQQRVCIPPAVSWRATGHCTCLWNLQTHHPITVSQKLTFSSHGSVCACVCVCVLCVSLSHPLWSWTWVITTRQWKNPVHEERDSGCPH